MSVRRATTAGLDVYGSVEDAGFDIEDCLYFGYSKMMYRGVTRRTMEDRERSGFYGC